MNSDRPARRFGLLQRLLADDRALLRTTAKAFDDLMSDNEMASRLTMRHESDYVDTSWKVPFITSGHYPEFWAILASLHRALQRQPHRFCGCARQGKARQVPRARRSSCQMFGHKYVLPEAFSSVVESGSDCARVWTIQARYTNCRQRASTA